MRGIVHAFDFVDAELAGAEALPSLIAIYGDEPYLKQVALRKIKQVVDSEDGAPIASWEGAEARWADISDELLTPTLFGSGLRIVIVRGASTFVTSFRGQLEDYVASDPVGATLVLELKTWPSNTRLAKAVAKTGLAVTCRAPERKSGRHSVLDTKRMRDWTRSHAADEYQVKLTAGQAELVFDLVGENLGLIDGELAKLALFADEKGKLTDELVTEVVGGWRTQSTWDLLDKICEGDAAAAIAQLDRLIQSGEHPQALFGAFAWSLRRFAAAVRVIELQEAGGSRPSLSAALKAVGVREFPKDRFEGAVKQLRQIGRQRAEALYRMLLEADLKMKRSHSPAPRARFVLEEMIFQLSTAMQSKRSA